MLNTKLIKTVKIIISIVILLITLSVGCYLGKGIEKYKQNKEEQSQTTGTFSRVKKQLTEKEVKDFLVVFFTKKDLGENRERYKPYVTEGMYNALVSEEESPKNQSYKGFIIDYEFQNVEIFVNRDKEEALVVVTYKNTLLASKEDEARRSTNTNKEGFKLTYQEKDGKLLVNKMDRMVIEQRTRELHTMLKHRCFLLQPLLHLSFYF